MDGKSVSLLGFMITLVGFTILGRRDLAASSSQVGTVSDGPTGMVAFWAGLALIALGTLLAAVGLILA
jgi:hypothetical protein